MIHQSLMDAFQTGGRSVPSLSQFLSREPSETPAATSGQMSGDSDRFSSALSTAQSGYQKFSMQFRHLSIRREIASLRSRSDASETDTRPKGDALLRQQVQEQRQTELSLFYARTQQITVQDPAIGEHLQSTTQGVGRTFEVSISLDATFLEQFAGQAETFSEGDAALFDKYLSATDQMVGISADATQGFFDMVDQALRETQSRVMDGLDTFLNDVGASLGLEGDALTNFKSQVADQVASFFSEMGQYVSEARDRIALPQAPSESPEALAPAAA